MTPFDDLRMIFHRRADAVAFLSGSEKYPEIEGRVFFYTIPNGVLVRAEVAGLPTANEACDSPIFAFHIHEGIACTGNQTDPFASANGHYNPHRCPHPYHAGDLPPLFSVDGIAFSAFLTDRFTVSEILNKTIIIHDKPDDFTTQPSGNAGNKIACGTITPTAR